MSAKKIGEALGVSIAGLIGTAVGGPAGGALMVGITKGAQKESDKNAAKSEVEYYKMLRTYDVLEKEKVLIPFLPILKNGNKIMQYTLVKNESVYFLSPFFNAVQLFRLWTTKQLKDSSIIPVNLKAAIYALIDWLISIYGFDTVLEYNLEKDSTKTIYPTSPKLGIIISSVLALALVSIFVYLKLRVND